MNDIAPEYDVILLGTGLTECALAGAQAVKGKKVLHMDKNDHYGGEIASFNLEQMFRKFLPEEAESKPWEKFITPADLEANSPERPYRNADWNIDLTPKFMMADGEFVNIVVACNMNNASLFFTLISGAYVQQGNGPRATIAKVPTTATEALVSPLMGMFEKRRARNFLNWVRDFDEDNPSTHQGMNLMQTTMKQVYDKFGLEASTRDFVGHSMALYSTDEYMFKKGMAKDCVDRIRLFVNSMARHGSSPFLYPQFGLGEFPQAFARYCAVNGGTYMLNTNVDEIKYGDDGKVCGIRATMKDFEGEDVTFETKCKKIFADPSYFPNKVRTVGHILRAICILQHDVDKFGGAASFQLIIPQTQTGRKHDIYVALTSSAQAVVPRSYSVATVTTMRETNGDALSELKPGIDRLGAIKALFIGEPIPIHEPIDDGTKDNIFVSASYDASSNLETATDDLKSLWRRAEGEELKIEGAKPGESLIS